MHVLMTGRGTSGSWQIRGAQLGSAIGAEVIPTAIDVERFDVAVLVKRTAGDLIQRLHAAGVPIVWDIVDAWPQPAGNAWSRTRSIEWLIEMFAAIRPSGIVAATQSMARDCERFGVPVLALPHHSRPGLRLNPIRPARIVGYEGGEHYLGRWRPIVEAECERRGWEFVINPSELADVDIVIAVRDSVGYAPRNWKSNVKLANAQGSGTPVICNREAGYLETASGAEYWADDAQELTAAFDELTPTQTRLRLSSRLKAAEFSLDSVAATYLSWLRSRF